ncbi:DUF1684 domain-containing protein [Actinacidiphila yeochonensis]|uniref:DUF1684 domain-containing protein n=1 Tax=Actinacidiphila yeochonensis TaxID=89050 RepID=UPI00056871E7|nr:DUF1684 domain-containing protein [Actinacidiphila yeochonensis]
MSTDNPAETRAEWERWRARRTAAVSTPHGPLALVGTYWLDDYPDGELPALPGRWRPQGGLVHHEVDGGGTVLEPEGRPLLLPDGRKALAIDREGFLAVRLWDPQAPARQAFAGIDAFDWDAKWVVPAVFRPFAEQRTVQVPNADGRERGLGLTGELSFSLDGTACTVSATVQEDGGLWAVIADATSGKSSFHFRFLYAPEPAADGSLTLDLNRTSLPPCAFADAFICPFPPPGNTLPLPLEAGERALLAS